MEVLDIIKPYDTIKLLILNNFCSCFGLKRSKKKIVGTLQPQVFMNIDDENDSSFFEMESSVRPSASSSSVSVRPRSTMGMVGEEVNDSI